MFSGTVAALRLPDLRRRMLYTVALLFLFRLLVHIPAMPFDRARLAELIREDQLVFAWEVGSGGALSSLSVLAIGLGPTSLRRPFWAFSYRSSRAWQRSLGMIARGTRDLSAIWQSPPACFRPQ
jgi:hypothetical protein